MAATLQERLNYLVNYSSQLIFVGGDTLSSQTKALESFLFQQGENTEIAYIVAEPDTEISELRFDLCKQLLGHASQFYHRPLNECLASLNNFDGPVMIAITRAERMPKQLLQELWELVLQSRFAGNKQHLNVILFADKRWATEAKTWLPANNSGTPLLLSTQQASLYKAMPDAQQISTAHTHIKARALATTSELEHDIEQRPLASMGAFWAATTLIFICAFIGVTVWQKGDELSALFAPLSPESNETQTTQASTVSKQTHSEAEPQNKTQANSGFASHQTVLNWEQNKTAKTVRLNEPVLEVVAPTTAKTQNSEASNLPDEDLKSTELPTQNTRITNTQVSETAAYSNEEEALRILPNKQSLARSGSFKPNHFALQFAGFKNPTALAQFRKNNALESITTVYRTQRYGGDWYVLVHKPVYKTPTEARKALYALPNFATKSETFVKSTNAIIKELSLTNSKDTLSNP